MKASRTVTPRTVTRTVSEVVMEPEITLTLSEEEAYALMAVVGTIDGHVNSNNVRTTTDKIYHKLQGVGIDFYSAEVGKYTANFSRSLRVGGEE